MGPSPLQGSAICAVVECHRKFKFREADRTYLKVDLRNQCAPDNTTAESTAPIPPANITEMSQHQMGMALQRLLCSRPPQNQPSTWISEAGIAFAFYEKLGLRDASRKEVYQSLRASMLETGLIQLGRQKLHMANQPVVKVPSDKWTDTMPGQYSTHLFIRLTPQQPEETQGELQENTQEERQELATNVVSHEEGQASSKWLTPYEESSQVTVFEEAGIREAEIELELLQPEDEENAIQHVEEEESLNSTATDLLGVSACVPPEKTEAFTATAPITDAEELAELLGPVPIQRPTPMLIPVPAMYVDLPSQLDKWTEDDVTIFLRHPRYCNIPQYADSFKENGIDGCMLGHLTDEA